MLYKHLVLHLLVTKEMDIKAMRGCHFTPKN